MVQGQGAGKARRRSGKEKSAAEGTAGALSVLRRVFKHARQPMSANSPRKHTPPTVAPTIFAILLLLFDEVANGADTGVPELDIVVVDRDPDPDDVEKT